MSCTRITTGWRFLEGREHEPFDESSIRANGAGKTHPYYLCMRIHWFSSCTFAFASLLDHLSLLDIAESGLQDLALDLGQKGAISHDLIVGDVCGQALLANVFSAMVLSRFACCCPQTRVTNGRKAFAAARTNVLGTLQIVQAASAFGAEKMAVIFYGTRPSPRQGLWVRQRELQNSWYWRTAVQPI
jgi:hypothetical protein